MYSVAKLYSANHLKLSLLV